MLLDFQSHSIPFYFSKPNEPFNKIQESKKHKNERELDMTAALVKGYLGSLNNRINIIRVCRSGSPTQQAYNQYRYLTKGAWMIPSLLRTAYTFKQADRYHMV